MASASWMGWRISRRKGGRKGRRKGWKDRRTEVKLVFCNIKGGREGKRENETAKRWLDSRTRALKKQES